MKLLLDSHIIVWWLDDSRQLTPAIRAAIIDPASHLFMSAASVWELALKIAKGQLKLPDDYVNRLRTDGFTELPVTIKHAVNSTRLPALHRDPFDRLLIAQALAEGLVLVTHDNIITRYDVPVLEA